jgi:hypothetical protein
MRLRVTFRLTPALPVAALADSQLERHAGKKTQPAEAVFFYYEKTTPLHPELSSTRGVISQWGVYLPKKKSGFMSSRSL